MFLSRTTPSLLANVCVTNMTYPLPSAGDGGDSGVSKDEKLRRLTRQNCLQAVIIYLLSTASSL